MADPATRTPAQKRTYTLTVPALDLMGDPPTGADVTVHVRLARGDGNDSAPLFGPDGAVVGTESVETFTAAQRPAGTGLVATSVTFELIPTGYFFVSTAYILTLGGRSYQFAMPAADANIVALLDDEGGSSGNVTPGTPGVAARAIPIVTSVADATELADAESGDGTPLFALVTADFGDWEIGDLIVWTGSASGWQLLVRTHTPTTRSRGPLLAWFQAAGAAAVPDPVATVQITDNDPALSLSHAGTATAQTLYVAHPDALTARYGTILIDGFDWGDLFTPEAGGLMVNTVRMRVYGRGGVDVTGGVGPLAVSLRLAAP